MRKARDWPVPRSTVVAGSGDVSSKLYVSYGRWARREQVASRNWG